MRQWQACVRFYHECRKRGVHVNSPDWYFLGGSNKTAMGCREGNWSLPRARQVVTARQSILDGTFEKTASMGWMTVDTDAAPRRYSRLIFSGSLEHFDGQVCGGVSDLSSALSDERGFRKDVFAAMKELRLACVRWPGVCFPSGDHGKGGTNAGNGEPHAARALDAPDASLCVAGEGHLGSVLPHGVAHSEVM